MVFYWQKQMVISRTIHFLSTGWHVRPRERTQSYPSRLWVPSEHRRVHNLCAHEQSELLETILLLAQIYFGNLQM